MRRLSTIGLYLCILAVWMQFVAPVAARSMDHAADPFSVICKTGAAKSDGGPAPVQPSHVHQCCLVCHADFNAAPLDPPPAERAAVRLPSRVALPGMDIHTPLPDPSRRHNRPRGPPAFV